MKSVDQGIQKLSPNSTDWLKKLLCCTCGL